MIIDQKLLLELLEQAAENPRLRVNLDLRTSGNDCSQRMLNALQPGTVVPIHRHRATTETVACLYGSVDFLLYDDRGNLTDRITLDPAAGRYGLQIPLGCWHTVDVAHPAVILESKDTPYSPLSPADLLHPSE